jgi:1-acyl-sn-glycerol-3-phosphate acyltransferase
MSQRLDDPLTLRSPWRVALFSAYARRFLVRHLHAVRVLRNGARPALPEGPLIVALNHASWWDPMVSLVLAPRLGRTPYAPIDAEQLERYGFFKRLGFFGVDRESRSTLRAFLRTSERVLQQPDAALWITPQGRFVDARQRPTELAPGLGHLARRLERGTVLPVAIEDPFWDERLPEALVAFGDPVPVTGGGSAAGWTARLSTALEATQDRLAAAAVARDPSRFDTLLAGDEGVGGVYDGWRRARAALAGRRFDVAHGTPALPAGEEAA